MQVFVRTLQSTTSTIDIEGSDTVAVVKQKIAAKLRLNPADIGLSFGAKLLDDKTPIEDYNVQKNCTLQLVTRLPGGSAH
jgi:hypothetical protein